MGERWLRAVEAYDEGGRSTSRYGGTAGGEDCSCDDCVAAVISGTVPPHPGVSDPDWGDGGGGGAPGELTEVVLIDGQLVDVRRRPVQGSGYECAAYELEGRGLLRGPTVVERTLRVREEPHEAMLDWLARVVGGEESLADLDATPLPTEEELDLSAIPSWARERARLVDEHVQGAFAHDLVGPELLTACRRLLVRAAGVGAFEMWREVRLEALAATVLHCAVKANDLSADGYPFALKTLLQGIGTKGYPTHRSRRLAGLLGGASWPHGRHPREAPAVYVLGDSGLLVSRFRRDLVRYRDRAERLAEQQP